MIEEDQGCVSDTPQDMEYDDSSIEY